MIPPLHIYSADKLKWLLPENEETITQPTNKDSEAETINEQTLKSVRILIFPTLYEENVIKALKRIYCILTSMTKQNIIKLCKTRFQRVSIIQTASEILWSLCTTQLSENPNRSFLLDFHFLHMYFWIPVLTPIQKTDWTSSNKSQDTEVTEHKFVLFLCLSVSLQPIFINWCL